MSIEAMKLALEALELAPYMSNKDDHDYYAKAIEALRTAIQQAESEPDDVVRDAERYRWLRDRDHWPAPFASSQDPEPVRGIDLDAAIDAAIAKATGEEK